MNETKFLKLLQIAHKEEQNMDSYIELSDASEKFDASRKRFLKVQDLVLDSNDYDKMYRFLQQNFENTDINKFIVKFLDATKTENDIKANYVLCIPFLNNSPELKIRKIVLDKDMPLSPKILDYFQLLNKSNPYKKALPADAWEWYDNTLSNNAFDDSQLFDNYVNFLFRNYAFAYIFGDNEKKHEKAILNSLNYDKYGFGKSALCYYFARDVNGANIKAFEKIILADKNPNYCYLFARDIEQADIHALCKVLSYDKYNSKYIIKLVQQDIENTKQKIEHAKNKKYIMLLSNENNYDSVYLTFEQIKHIVKNGVGDYKLNDKNLIINKDNYDIVIEKNREILNQLVDYSQKLDRLDNIYKTINKKIKTETNEQSQVL